MFLSWEHQAELLTNRLQHQSKEHLWANSATLEDIIALAAKKPQQYIAADVSQQLCYFKLIGDQRSRSKSFDVIELYIKLGESGGCRQTKKVSDHEETWSSRDVLLYPPPSLLLPTSSGSS